MEGCPWFRVRVQLKVGGVGINEKAEDWGSVSHGAFSRNVWASVLQEETGSRDRGRRVGGER